MPVFWGEGVFYIWLPQVMEKCFHKGDWNCLPCSWKIQGAAVDPHLRERGWPWFQLAVNFYLWFRKYRTYALKYQLLGGRGKKISLVAVWILRLNHPGLCHLAVGVYSKMMLTPTEQWTIPLYVFVVVDTEAAVVAHLPLCHPRQISHRCYCTQRPK